LTPASGTGKKPGSGSGIRNEQPGSYFLELRKHFLGLKILKLFDADPGSGSGMGKVGSGIRNPEKHSGSDPQHCRWNTVAILRLRHTCTK